jgi:protein gp37
LRTLALPPDDAVTALFEPPLRNVWLGVSTEDQRRAEERVPVLLDTPAAVRWVSAEPLLGPLRMDGWLRSKPSRTVLDWVVAGGESGPGARPAHPDWFRTIRDQCASAGVPFFFKQWGGWQTIYDRDGDDPDWRRCDSVKRKTPRGQWLNLAGGQGFHGERVLRVVPVSKARAGAELDGRLHREFPT